mmetsp:Transcript_8436/g.9717  ORF Transcript_8436/g.9717 Transcript_8436/m.9717 type:complete len:781 (-) Transcript_8436:1795-4137(-)
MTSSLTFTLYLLFSTTLFFSKIQSSSAKGTTLIKHGITTRTDVTAYADIAKDVSRMFAECENQDFDAAYDIYSNGKNALYSLKQLATDSKYKNVGLTFAFHMYGLLGNDFDYYDNANLDKYTSFSHHYMDYLLLKDDDEPNTGGIVNNNDVTPDEKSKCEMASHAAMWHILYLQASYGLWGAMKDCAISADPSYDNDAAGITDLNAKLDEFIAYWVGSLNSEVASVNGYSLWSATNEIGIYFNTHESGVALTNKHIRTGYEALSSILSVDGACDQNKAPATLKSLWMVNNKILSYMMVPLVQNLIKAMLDDHQSYIDVYAKMVVPQLVQCRYSNYEFLKKELLDQPFNKQNIHSIAKVLHDSYSCLGISCEMVGEPMGLNDSLLSCDDENYKHPILAGYPTTTHVAEQSKIDLDLYQMKILMSFDNDNYWMFAKHIYEHGKNSKKEDYYTSKDDDSVNYSGYEFNLRSLHDLAVSSKRYAINVLFSEQIQEYHNDDRFYANTAIMDMFNDIAGSSYEQGLSRKNGAAVISSTILTQVIYMYVLAELTQVVDINTGSYCDEAESYNWDEAAAYIIGSLEGSSFDGQDGELLWGLANKRSLEFDRQNEDGYAIVNSAVKNLLWAGKGQILNKNCLYLDRTVKSLSHMLLIPMIQTLIKYALVNQYKMYSSHDVTIYEGEVYAHTLIPIFGKYSQKSANVLQRNMVRRGSLQEIVPDGPQAVADAYLDIADDFGIQCEFIGKSYEVDSCLNYSPKLSMVSDASVASWWRFGTISVGIITWILL